MVYGPTCTVDTEGDCVYSTLNSADWWWQAQDRLPAGATYVPLISESDEMQLMDCTGAKTSWPRYLTIGNIHSSMWIKYRYLVQILVALLQVGPKFELHSGSDDRAQRNIRQQLRGDIAKILQDLVTRSPDREDIKPGALWPCSKGKTRCCWPILASWLVDYMAHGSLMGVKYNACPNCETPNDEPGWLILLPDLESHRGKSVVFQKKYWEGQNINCKGTYASVRPHRHTCGNHWNTVANMDASDSRCRCIVRLSLEI